MATFDPVRNLAVSTVQAGSDVIASTTGTTVVVGAGHGARFAAGANVTITPPGQSPAPEISEIVRITAISGDSLTVIRGQESTTVKETIAAGHAIFQAPTAKTVTDITSVLSGLADGDLGVRIGPSEPPQPQYMWVDTGEVI